MEGQFRDYTNYIIYSDGRIYSKIRKKFMTNKITKDGYSRMELYKDKKPKMFNVHRVIAEVFIDNPENKPFVNHIDGNKQNNKFENLEWVTQKENIEHAHRIGLSKKQKVNTGPLCKKVYMYVGDNLVNVFPSISEVKRQLGYQRYMIQKACENGHEFQGCFWRYNKTSND